MKLESQHHVRTLIAAISLAAVAWQTTPVAAEDVVHLVADDSSGASAKLTGTIIDYSGRELVIEMVAGYRRTLPGAKVASVETTWLHEQLEADSLLAQRQYQSAIERYLAAGRSETRRWVRRKILAQMVVCHRELGQWQAAGDLFLALLQDDAQTPYFDCIPLPWLSSVLDPAFEQHCEAWMARADSHAAVLLGASHLALSQRADGAMRQLDMLARDRDPRIAALAEAQLWRGSFITAGPERVAAWSDRVTMFPESLRGGPYFVLGRAQAHYRQHEAAALAFMRVPILYASQRSLAAESLWGAAQALDQLGQRTEAARVYRELIDGHPDANSAALARERLGTIEGEL